VAVLTKYVMEQGVTYLIKEAKPDNSLKIFTALVRNGAKGFCITRVHPKRIRKRFELGDTPILWITTSEVPDEKCVHPSDLAKLNMAINETLKKQEDMVLLLEGIEYLVTYNGFDSILRFVQVINDRIMVSKSRFIITLDPATLDTGSLHILERDLEPIENLDKLEIVFSEFPGSAPEVTSAGAEEWKAPLQERIRSWKEKGYEVAALESAMTGGKDDATKLFDQYQIQDELRTLAAAGFAKETEGIGPKLKDPLSLKDAEEELLMVQVAGERRKKEEVRRKGDEERRRDEYKNKLKEWTSIGFGTGRLATVLAGPLDAVKKDFEQFEASIQKLKELREELLVMNISGFEKEVDAMRPRFLEPDKVNDLEDDIFRLRILIERRNKEDRRRKEDDEKVTGELQKRLDRWRSEGFDVTRVQEYHKRPTLQAAADFESFEKSVNALKELEGELSLVPPKGNESEILRIRNMLRSPERLQDAREAFAVLRRRSETGQLDARREELRRKIMEWEVQGYNTDKLKDLMDSDVDTIQKEMVLYKVHIQRLKELEGETAALRSLLKNVEKIPESESRLTELRLKLRTRQDDQKKLKEESSRLKRELLGRLEAWMSQGFSVKRLQSALESGKDAEALRKDFDSFEDDIVRAKELSAKVQALKAPGHENELSEILAMLSDIDRLAEAEDALAALLTKLEAADEDVKKAAAEDNRRKQKARERIDAWKSQGLNVTSLESALSISMEAFRKELGSFSQKVEKVKGLRAELEGIDAKGFEDDVQAITRKLADTELAEEAEQDIKALRTKISEKAQSEQKAKDVEKEERNAFVQKFLAYASQGLIVENLERNIDQPLEKVRSEFAEFEAGLKTLDKVRSDVDAMDVKGFEDDVDTIFTKLKDPMHADDAVALLTELKGKIERSRAEEADREAREARRTQIMDRVNNLRQSGFNVARIDALARGDVGQLAEAFETFMGDVKRLRGIRKAMDALDTDGFADSVEQMSKKLQDPDRLAELDSEFEALKAEISKKQAALKARRDSLDGKVEGWRKEGLNVAKLRESSKGHLDAYEQAVAEFEESDKERREAEDKLKAHYEKWGHPEEGQVKAVKIEKPGPGEEPDEGEEEAIDKAQEEVEREVRRIRKAGLMTPQEKAEMEKRLKAEHQAQLARMQAELKRKHRYNLILIGSVAVAVVLILTVVAWPILFPAPEPEGIQIDGKFEDWTDVSKKTDDSTDQTINPSVNIIQWATSNENGALDIYIKTDGLILKGRQNSTSKDYYPDTVRIYFDTDGRTDTGYQIGGMGADMMAEISGYNNNPQVIYYLRYTPGSQPPWSIMDNDVSVKAAHQEMEMRLVFTKFGLDSLPVNRMLIEARDTVGNYDLAQ
jgi:hypothetical protein